MAAFSLDLRQRIVDAYDAGEGTRQEIADRFRVSLGMVKKLLQQRRSTGDIADRHHLTGRKATITGEHRRRFDALVHDRPDITLEELRAETGLRCSLPAIHYVLKDMGLTLKKRRSLRPNKTGATSMSNAKPGKRK